MNVQELQRACRVLADRCDGASAVDGQGFSKIDSDFGKSLAGQSLWTPKQAEAAIKLLQRYKGQLAAAGFDVGTLFNNHAPTPSTGNPVPVQPQSRGPRKTAKLVEDEVVEIWFDFDSSVVEFVKTLPGRRFQSDGKGKYWTVPPSTEVIEELRKAGFTLCPALQSFGKIDESTPPTPLSKLNLKRQLYPFQEQGVTFIEAKKGRALLADEMGLGKSIQALAWLALHPEKRPVIILCPAHLKLNWMQEIRKTLPGNPNIQVLQGTKPYKITGDLVIINYDILSDWLRALHAIKPQVLIFDEAHYVKSSTAQRTKATKKLAREVDKELGINHEIPHVIALTGTPIINRPIEGFNIVQIVNRKVFPGFWEYAHRYCGANHNRFGWDLTGATNKEELHQKLTSTIMLRRKKADVLKDLPDKIHGYVPVELDNRGEYERAETEFIEWLAETKGEKAAAKAQQAEHLVRIENLKQLAIQGKLKQAIQWIQDFLDGNNGDKLVVFTTHKAPVARLMEEFGAIAVKVDGSVSPEKRHEAVQKFQNDPAVRLFVGNIQAAGTGLTLTAASTVAFLELPWTPGELVQAEDRLHRIGQKNAVNVYYLLATETIEFEIAEMLDSKRTVLNAIIDGTDTPETQMLTELMRRYETKKEKGRKV